jgi:hypothetical protein
MLKEKGGGAQIRKKKNDFIWCLISKVFYSIYKTYSFYKQGF